MHPSIVRQENYTKDFGKTLEYTYRSSPSWLTRMRQRIFRQPAGNEVSVTLTIQGTQSECIIFKGDRQCAIRCHDIDCDPDYDPYKGPEYLIDFIEQGDPVKHPPHGKVRDKTLALQAVTDWINGKSMAVLYEQYAFIDTEARWLQELKTTISTAAPLLVPFMDLTTKDWTGIPVLHIVKDSRRCNISYMYFAFYWDESFLFDIKTQISIPYIDLVKQWVYDAAMPSSLKAAFPDVDFGKLSAYFEDGRGVEGEFFMEWDRVYAFYDSLRHEWSAEMQQLILAMRAKGFDRLLRPGTSLYTLVLSRSRRYGMQSGQPFIRFEPWKGEVKVGTEKGPVFTTDKLVYNDTIEHLLQELAKEPIT